MEKTKQLDQLNKLLETNSWSPESAAMRAHQIIECYFKLIEKKGYKNTKVLKNVK